jgi:hypothetical protein
MPEYDLVLSGDNFLSSVQAVVEYGENRVQPKKIVVDLAPKFLDKVNNVSTGQWLEIFAILMKGLGTKDILMYFNDLDMRNFAIQENFDGSIKETKGDYLMVNIANIKGSKTDKYTNSEAEVNVSFKGEKIIHEVKLMRRHNGGREKYGFYNRQNPAYVRFLIPENAELISVEGNDNPDLDPLISYEDRDFITDYDLKDFEGGFHEDEANGVDIFSESGKKGVGLWLIVDPGRYKTVTLKYETSFNPELEEYSLYIQKQPGVILQDVNLTFNMADLDLKYYSPGLNKIGNIFNSTGPLDSDLQLGFIFE